MAKVRVHNFSITLDGFGAGPGQRLDAPFGDGVEGLHDWMMAAMEGGTTFHFTDEPAEKVLERAIEAAGGEDVIIAGGAATIQQYLRAGLIDELNLVVVPLLAGAGERLFDNLGEALTQYRVAEQASSATVTHVRLLRR